MIGAKARELFAHMYEENKFQDYSLEGFLKMADGYLQDYVICEMPGGTHGGSCPTCGCKLLDQEHSGIFPNEYPKS